MSLSDLRASISGKEQQISQINTENNMYQEKVNALAGIYSDMKSAKECMVQQKKNMRSFAQAEYPLWKGSHFKNNYRSFLLGQNQSNYSTLISQIDQNMAAVNNKKAEYQNKIYQNQGFIGCLRSAINSLWTQIQNWVD